MYLRLRKFMLLFSSVIPLPCIILLGKETLKFAACYCRGTLMCRQGTAGMSSHPYYHCYCCCFDEAKLCLRKLILLILFSQQTPLHRSARGGHLAICRLLVESKADIHARSRCFINPLPLLTMFHSLSALQRWQNCTQMRC